MGTASAQQVNPAPAVKRSEEDDMDEPMRSDPAPDEAGALYCVTYASGYVGLVDAEGLRIAQMEAASPARDEGTAIERVERLQGDQWVFHDPWHTAVTSVEGQDRSVIEHSDFDVHYDPETGTASVQAEYGDRPDLGDASAAEPVERHRLQQLADRIRDWFQRDRDRGMEW
jgi:hypothetical protein